MYYLINIGDLSGSQAITTQHQTITAETETESAEELNIVHC